MSNFYKVQIALLDSKTNQVAIHGWNKIYTSLGDGDSGLIWHWVFTRTCTGFDRAQDIADQWQRAKGIKDVDLLLTIDTRG